MKKLIFFSASLLLTTILATSCDDDVNTTGSSLITDKSEIVIDSSFVAQGKSVEVKAVQSRTLTQLIGRLQADGFGDLSSEIVTQFMPSLNLDTAGTSADDIISMDLLMFFTTGAFTGDSLAPMGINIYPLTKQLPSPIYSDFDPTDYYDKSNMWESKIYTGNALYSDSLSNLSYRTIKVTLPMEFAKKFFNEYKTNPSTFATPTAFSKFFPGLYIKNSFGNGRITNIRETRINMKYIRHSTYTKDDEERDTTYTITKAYMSVTPEVVSNNIIRYSISNKLKAMAEAGRQIVVAPVGYNVELKFPLLDIISAYKAQSGQLNVINSLSLSIPAAEIANDYGIQPPENLLIVLKKEVDEFFAKNKLNDDETSFLATYNSSTKTYDVTGMRQYLLNMLDKETIDEEDYTFVITPVNIETEESESSYYYTSTVYVTAITPYVTGASMVELLLNDAKIKLTFGKQSAIY